MRRKTIDQPKRKVTWNDVYKDFKRRFPRLRLEVGYWRPYDVGTILLYFPKGIRATYEYDRKELKFLNHKGLDELYS